LHHNGTESSKFHKILHVFDFYTPIKPERSVCGYTTNTKETVCSRGVGACDAQIQTTFTPSASRRQQLLHANR